jgi:hypothetical protein
MLVPPKKKKQNLCSWAPVAHTYNHNCAGGRDQEDRGLKPAWANSWRNYCWREIELTEESLRQISEASSTVPAQTQRTRVQRLNPENKGVSP